MTNGGESSGFRRGSSTPSPTSSAAWRIAAWGFPECRRDLSLFKASVVLALLLYAGTLCAMFKARFKGFPCRSFAQIVMHKRVYVMFSHTSTRTTGHSVTYELVCFTGFNVERNRSMSSEVEVEPSVSQPPAICQVQRRFLGTIFMLRIKFLHRCKRDSFTAAAQTGTKGTNTAQHGKRRKAPQTDGIAERLTSLTS